MVGAVYDLALQLGKFDDDLTVRDGEGYNEGPIATPSPTLYFEVGDFLTDLSLNTEGMVEDLFTSNYELLEIRSRQLEVIHLLSQLIASARALKEKFKKLMLYSLRRVVSSSMEPDSDSF
ncbi:uncharacterized protein LOC107046352 [Diachasma alloeum]|uniref:uncharacterized protein LOC107046352 n=1 Tax=Diachasma alloeum TaxID=454923 RepID=UPI0007381D30|nr:uncharacterized protein LOC107046352 [Diachasma alloeum]